MSLSSLTTQKIFNYTDQKRVYKPQDGSSGANQKYRALTLTLWDLKSRFVLPWDKRTVTLVYYDSVVDYSAEEDLDHILSIVPQDFTGKIDRKSPDEFHRFDDRGVTDIFAENITDSVKKILLKFNGKNNAILVDAASQYNTGGTWLADTTGSDALNITTDKLEYYEYGASVNFDVDVSQSANNYATIYKIKDSAIDLSDEEDKAPLIAEVWLPDKTNISSVTLYWGSDTSATPSTKANYWYKAATTRINNGAFINGRNTIKFDWDTATKVGSPDSSAIKYLELRITYSASQVDDTDFRINYIRCCMPENVDLEYSTAYIAKNTGGTYIDEITADNDVMLFSGIDTKFMKAIISGCLFQLFGDNNTQEGKKEASWEKRYEEDILRLELEYPTKIIASEQRIRLS